MATTTIRDAPAPAPAAPASANANANAKRNKRTFMLHEPSSMSALGRFVSTDWRYGALKAASRGHTKILLRQTGTREVREFNGSRVEIEPKEITRGGRTIVYTHRPQVKFVSKFVYTGAIDDSADVATNPVVPDAAPAA